MKNHSYNNSFNLLNHWAQAGVAYLHPGGRQFTSWLIEQLQPMPGMHVLEVGCGTGASLADFALLPDINLTGIDISEPMLASARQRIQYCQLTKKVRLLQTDVHKPLPFPDAFFHHIYAESVLGILSFTTLNSLLPELYRVLKPGGLFITSDAIWTEDSTPDEREHTNQRCLKAWGIIQSCTQPATRIQWQQLFEQFGFTCRHVYDMHTIQASSIYTNSRSVMFTKKKRLFSLLDPIYMLRELRVQWLLRTTGKTSKILLQHDAFVLQK